MSVVVCGSFGVGACAGQTQPSVTDVPTSLGVSGTQSSESGGQKITADVVMSGEYEVGPDGRLLRPKDPSVVLPPLPDAAREFSEEGAYAFSEYWLDTLAYAWNTGKIEPVRNISDPECKFCSGIFDGVKNLEERREWAKGFQYVIKERHGSTQVSQTLFAVVLDVQREPFLAYVDNSIMTIEPERKTIEFQPCWKGEYWMMCGGAISSTDPQS